MSLQSPPKALLFDVFGTVVDWRSSICKVLITSCQRTLQNNDNIPRPVRDEASAMSAEDWGAFAQEWRNAYSAFTRGFGQNNNGKFITIDEHHYISLTVLLKKWQLEGLWTEAEIEKLALAWHYLTPWDDSSKGLEGLNKRFITSTLSNGNTALLEDLAKHGPLPFKHLCSAEQFKAYKPSPAVYNGAAQKLGLQTSECALVAAHLGDLKAAKGCGYQTIYVERPREESWSTEEIEKAKAEGWVDMWIGRGDEGFLEIAKRFGIS